MFLMSWHHRSQSHHDKYTYPSSYSLYVQVGVLGVGTAGLGDVPAVVPDNASSVDAHFVVVGWVVDGC